VRRGGEADGGDVAREVDGAAGGPRRGVVRRQVEAVPDGRRVGLVDEPAEVVVGAGGQAAARRVDLMASAARSVELGVTELNSRASWTSVTALLMSTAPVDVPPAAAVAER
jgi:hypothetical protein